jgi:large subunit ribosomal protein L4
MADDEKTDITRAEDREFADAEEADAADAEEPVAEAAPAADRTEEPRDVATASVHVVDVELPDSVFGQTPNDAVMHQAFMRQAANARQGSAATKTRATVRGGGAKPYRQKGTGRARHGSNREPSMVGGAVAFGPQPRSFTQRMPRKMRRLALRSALSVKAREGKVSVVDGFVLEEPKTRVMADLLRGIGVDETVLLVLPAANDIIARSVSNLPWAKLILAQNLNLYDIFTHDRLVIARDALGLIEETVAS